MGYYELRAGQGIALEHNAGYVRIHALEQNAKDASAGENSGYCGFLAAGFADTEETTIAVTDNSLPAGVRSSSPAGMFLLDFLWRTDDETAELKMERYKFPLPYNKLSIPSTAALLCIKIAIASGSGSNGFNHPFYGSYHPVVTYGWFSALPQNEDMVFYFPVARYGIENGEKTLAQLVHGILSGLVVKSPPLQLPPPQESSSTESSSSGGESSSGTESSSSGSNDHDKDDESSSSNNESSSGSENSSDSGESSSSTDVPPPVTEESSSGGTDTPGGGDDTDKSGFYIIDQFIYSEPACTGDNEGSAITRAIMEYPYPECEDIYDSGEFIFSLHTITLLGPYPTYQEAEKHRADPV